MVANPWRRGLTAASLASLLVVGSDPALAAAPGSESGELLSVSGVAAVGVLIAGTLLLLASVELLVHAIVQLSSRFRVSSFALAVALAGFEFDNVALGVFNGFRELQNVSFGVAIGNAISMFGIVLALGALAYPFEVDVPDDYLALTVLVPFVLLPFIFLGEFTALAGAILVTFGVIVFAYIYWRERSQANRFVQSPEVREARVRADGNAAPSRVPGPLQTIARRDWFWIAMVFVAIAGIAAGAEGSSAGVEGVLETWNLSGTFVGVTVLTLFYTMDDLLLLVEPLRIGQPDIAVGGLVGTLLFLVTGNVGIVALIGTVNVGSATLLLHFPVLIGMILLSAYFLRRGTLDRRHGALLLGLYVGYLAVNVLLFSSIPVSGG